MFQEAACFISHVLVVLLTWHAFRDEFIDLWREWRR